MKFLHIIAGFSGFASCAIGIAADYEPSVLDRISARVDEVKVSGKVPVLVFDIDDTLTDSRVRTRAILRDYGNLPTVRETDLRNADLLVNMSYTSVKYSIVETLEALGVDQPDFIAAANQFWVREFFSNDYCSLDTPIAGAAKYVDSVHRHGGFIVYLTGRTQPDMQTCTQFGLMRHHFVSGEGTLLLMKPFHNVSDLDFKKLAFDQIRNLGEVVAGFENEPVNINAYQAAFPEAAMVFLDTIKSDNPVTPNSDISWIPNFLGAR